MLKCSVLLSAIHFTTFAIVSPLFVYEEVEVVSSRWSSLPVAVRQIEFLGGSDNGTLDCSIPGFTHYRWQITNKASSGPYAESSSLVLEGKIGKHQSTLAIGPNGFPMATELMVVSCEAMINGEPRFRIIWVINRMPLPVGYITDPRICDYGIQMHDFGMSCAKFRWVYYSDCYHGDGRDYRGTAYMTNRRPPNQCQYWFLNLPNRFSKSYAKKLDLNNGEHRYCRNPEPDKYRTPWCVSTSTSPNEQRQYCNVKECSECIYGNGDGTFDLYPGRKFPEYKGRGMISLTEDEKGLPRTCLTGSGMGSNTCRIKKGIKRPHCFIARRKSDESDIKKLDESDSRLEFAECRIPQCTVRQVWFLFFDSFGRPYLDESNYDAVEIVMVNKRKSETIKFGAFGIHLVSGLTVGTEDSKLLKFARSFALTGRLITRRSPGPLSTIVVTNVEKAMSGVYFVQYSFAEANPKIQQSTYKAKFKITVRDPTAVILKPKVVQLCRGESGSITLHITGGFDLIETSIKWKFGTSKSAITQEILADDESFDLAADFRKVTIKALKQGTWISVQGESFTGYSEGRAQFTLKAQPHLKATSPRVVHSHLGGDVNFTLEVERKVHTTWMYDAQVIPDVPDDPNMAFQRILKDDVIIESLIISRVDWRHFGVYSVEATKDGCKKMLTFKVEHEKGEKTLLPVTEELTTPAFTTTEASPTDHLLNQEYCTIYPLEMRRLQKGKQFTNLTIDLKCDEQDQPILPSDELSAISLPSCSAVTGYQFVSNESSSHRLLIGGKTPDKLFEYKGDVQVKLNFYRKNKTILWRIIHKFTVPFIAKHLQFISETSDRPFPLRKLLITGCPVDNSICRTNSPQAPEDLSCNDQKIPLYNELPVHEVPPCSLITGYQFVAEGPMLHTFLLSTNYSVLRKYNGDVKSETKQLSGNQTGKWLHIYKFSEPVAASYLQFVPDLVDSPYCVKELEISGCTLEETKCTSEWLGTGRFTCTRQDESMTNDAPLYELRRCSLIASYEFVSAETSSEHILLYGQKDAKTMLEFDREVHIEVIKETDGGQSKYFHVFAEPFPTRYLQFVCNDTGEANRTDKETQCLKGLQVSGCPVADALCEEEWFIEDDVEPQTQSPADFLRSNIGQFMLGMVIASALFVVAMFFAAEYDLATLLAQQFSTVRRRINLTEKIKLTSELWSKKCKTKINDSIIDKQNDVDREHEREHENEDETQISTESTPMSYHHLQ